MFDSRSHVPRRQQVTCLFGRPIWKPLFSAGQPSVATAFTVFLPMCPQRILEEYFGHKEFRGQQAAVIEHLLRRQHTLVIMPTGMGKSICYQIPALLTAQREVPNTSTRNLTVVISPLIALMKDQVDGLQLCGIDATYVNSSLSRQQREQRYQSIAGGHFDLLYVTPERFRKPEFVEVIQRRSVHLLAVDEAHCISEWGHDFRPDYTRLAEFRQLIGEPTTIALTATATPVVQKDIIRQLGLMPQDVRIFHEGIARPNLELVTQHVWDDDEKLEHLLNTIRCPEFQSGNGIIYFTLIKTLGRFSQRLLEEKVVHVCYHGELERQQRRMVQDQFMSGKQPLVLATNAFGMGIDKEDIRFVVHAEVPGSMEAYYQEIGRAGRDGLPSLCLLLYDQRDLAIQVEFIRGSNPGSDYYGQLYLYLTERREEIQAFGIDWLNRQLHLRGQSDFRLDTALAMLERYGVVRDVRPPGCFDVTEKLPGDLIDPVRMKQKLDRDQRKLYAMVEYANDTGNPKAFIHRYFGLPYRNQD